MDHGRGMSAKLFEHFDPAYASREYSPIALAFCLASGS